MSSYREYKELNLPHVATEVASFWKEHRVFQQSIEIREGNPSFIFYEGPPSANGVPGIHHLFAITIKDLFNRYKTLQGYQVKRRSGWDTHGLPVELQVEKKLGITKEDIGKKISIASYNEYCRQIVMQYKDQWEAMNQQIGYWIDHQNPYLTFDRNYIETLWYLLKELYNKGLLYKGFSIQPYSPAAGTGLSSHELNQPGCYKLVKDISIVAQFKICNSEKDYFLAWTTTPWTLPANSALAVDPTLSYIKVATYNPYTYLPVQVILAEVALPRYFMEKSRGQNLSEYVPGSKNIPWQIVQRYKGVDLLGITYEQLLPYVQPATPAFRVIQGDFITTDSGTGIVHVAPTFGANDYRIAQKEHIPAITVKNAQGEEAPIVDLKGRFVAEIVDFAGRYVKEAYEINTDHQKVLSVDLLIANKLKKENKAFKVEKYEHSYPHCWRTDQPILYYPLDAWFIKITPYKERLIELNKMINWKPTSIGSGRFGNWLENIVDWNLSRDRYWGTPLPIWRTVDQKEEICIGSLSELEAEVAKSIACSFMKKPLEADFDLHRPYVDEIILVSETGQPMYRETALVDVWFDSGAMPYAQWHYPFENKDIFATYYPADFIAEGVDQTRGWFFTLHVLSVLLFDQPAFSNVVVNGLVLDKNDQKMSKRLGNVVDAVAMMRQYGADAVRWYMISNANPWDNLKFDISNLREVVRKFFTTLHNTYNFFAMYANLDHFSFKETLAVSSFSESDRWMISKNNHLIKIVTEAYDAYEPTVAARAIQNFVVDDLSNWYVRLNRKRFWKNNQDDDKQAAYQVLYTVLITVAKLTSPIAPFYADRLYQDLNNLTQKESAISVHLSNFPTSYQNDIDFPLETRMQQVQTIVSLVHALRKQHNIKVRQPLAKIIIPLSQQLTRTTIGTLEDLIKLEVNIKSIEYVDETSTLVIKKAKPNFQLLGKKYGGLTKEIAQTISQLSQENIKRLEGGGAYHFYTTSGTIFITLEDILIISEDIPGWSVAHEETITVALDLTINASLKQEGLARDVVHCIQQIRKEKEFSVQDKIHVIIAATESYVINALHTYKDYIAHETQALYFDCVPSIIGGNILEWCNYKIIIRIEKVMN